ncbi:MULTISPECIES: ABC transporter substrate-binding protein [Bacillaceae]|uniref:Peptide ABC transporter substrate-binding protein n=1 Tax=Evansella alkalicola TaxID=745819 RepID=A0ABS6JSF9_9BACI|nr:MULTISPECIES: ABC transporter substrate-binding protein [Bacillaceae]MBU9721508.1 peptide ABC transporter substrate-binding protein [Bacillus alkalicola]
MKLSKFWLMLVLSLSLMLILVACGGDDEDTSAPEDEPEQTDDGTEDDGDDTDADTDADDGDEGEEAGGPQQGGMITAGMYSAPGHQFNPIFYGDAYEANILDFTHESLVTLNENFEYVPSLARDWELNDDQTELTYYLEENVTWHDGTPFTADDVYFTYSSIADGEYVASGGVRIDYVRFLVGYEDYRDGETDTFEGVEVVDEHTVKFHFAEPNVTPEFRTSFPIIPAHVFEGLSVADMVDHPASRNAGEIIGTGPYQLTDMLEGEQYVLTAYDNYWKGSPKLDGITWRVIEQSVMPGMLERGELDMIAEPNGVPAADFERVDGLDNVTTFTTQDFGYQYIGIKHHHRTAEDVENGVVDPNNWVVNEKVQDVRVRQAMMYALDREGIVGGLMNGLGSVLHAPFPEASWAYDESAFTVYEQNVEKANELLDEAGYIDVTGDGYREDPDGNEWTLNLDYPTGNEVRERTAPIIVAEFGEVGIRVDMRQPRDAATHFEIVEDDNTDWDLYLAGWSLATGDPDPAGIWKSDNPFNYLRWNDSTSDELIELAVKAPDAFDLDFRAETYNEWTAYVTEQVPMVFLYSSDNIYAYNSALQDVTHRPTGIYTDSHLWWLDQE